MKGSWKNMKKLWRKSLVFFLILSLHSTILVYADEGSGKEGLQGSVTVKENADAEDNIKEDVIIEEEIITAKDLNPELEKSEELTDGTNREKVEDAAAHGDVKQEEDTDEDQEDESKDEAENVPVLSPGWNQTEDGDWYYADQAGQMLTDWQFIKGAWYYLDGANSEKPGVMLSDQKKVIDNQIYFFNQSGTMLTGWVQRPEGWYYANVSGAMLTDWQFINGAWYYLDGANKENPGLMLSNCIYKIDGKTYVFDENGGMKTSWIQRSEGWYYADASGMLADGWRNINGAWYYLDGANQEYPYLMLSNCERQIGGVTYYFNAGGAMRAGWYLEGKDWYYYDTGSGQIVTGWIKVGGTWYYLNPANGNKMESSGWKLIGGTWYYFHSSGAMATNWLLLGSSWYYLGSDGAMRTGWQYIGNKWYYMYTANDSHGGSEGAMASNTIIDGYQLLADGTWCTGTELKARQVLDRVGWSLHSAFNWSARMTYKKMTADPSQGSEWFAAYGFENNRGNCYVMAATFCYMARQLGYDAHQMAGKVPTRSGGLTPHSWVEVNIGGSIYVFDPDFAKETGKNGYQISYGTSGTWKYSNYYRMN